MKVNWLRWEDKLGTMTDAALAKKLGVCRQAVTHRRRKIGKHASVIAREEARALRSCVLRSISTVTVKGVDEIWHDVINDYGDVTTRSVYRALAVLRKRGAIQQVRPEGTGSEHWGYLKKKKAAG